MIVTAQLTLSMLIGLCSLAARISAVKVPILFALGVVKIRLFRRSVPARFLILAAPGFSARSF